MVRLLDRYILADLVRNILLTTAVLVTVIAFGATIKPLASGLLAPVDIARYVLLAIVPMLQFALPFAAGFGATIVLHRMTGENEVLAAAAGGVSYRRFLAPIAGLGVVLTLVLLLLVHFVIPGFWVMMRQTVTNDATRLFLVSLEKGEAFRIGNIQIFADRFSIEAGAIDTGAEKSIRLYRLAAASLDDAGRVVQDVTARSARVDFHRIDDRAYIKLVMSDVSRFDRDAGTLSHAPQAESGAIALPDNTRESPKFMSLSQLLRLRSRPDDYQRISTARSELAAAITWRAMWADINQHLHDEGVLTFSRDDRSYIVHAAGLARGQLLAPAGRQVRIDEYRRGRLLQTMTVDRANLNATEPGALADHSEFLIELEDVTLRESEQPGVQPYRRNRMVLSGLRLEDRVTTSEQLPRRALDLLAHAEPMRESSPPVARAMERLERQLRNLDNEIYARVSQRFALAMTGFLLIMLGAALAMFLRHSLPLVIYLWAFIPSIADILLISGGEQIIRDGEILGGSLVMWSGNAILTLILLFTYHRLARN